MIDYTHVVNFIMDDIKENSKLKKHAWFISIFSLHNDNNFYRRFKV